MIQLGQESPNASELKTAQANRKSGTISEQPKTRPTAGKDSTIYWKNRLKKRTSSGPDGGHSESPHWYIRLRIGGEDEWFNLDTANRDAAANRAREIYLVARANGLTRTVEKFKPSAMKRPERAKSIGEWIADVESLGRITNRSTLYGYATALRMIVARLKGISDEEGSRFRRKSGIPNKWRDRVDAVPLDVLTPESIRLWQREYVKDRTQGRSSDQLVSVRRSANSFVRQARSLFAKPILRALGKPADFSPFRELEMLSTPSVRFMSKINFYTLIKKAKEELRAVDVEAYKAFLLASLAGLRKREIDGLEWRHVDLTDKKISLFESQFLSLKTPASRDTLSIDDELARELTTLKPGGDERFVLKSTNAIGRIARGSYRCSEVFEKLYKWLRDQGINSNKPLHELRKELGSHLALKQGIYQASRYLRHTDISTTSKHYGAVNGTVTPGLGQHLNA